MHDALRVTSHCVACQRTIVSLLAGIAPAVLALERASAGIVGPVTLGAICVVLLRGCGRLLLSSRVGSAGNDGAADQAADQSTNRTAASTTVAIAMMAPDLVRGRRNLCLHFARQQWRGVRWERRREHCD